MRLLRNETLQVTAGLLIAIMVLAAAETSLRLAGYQSRRINPFNSFFESSLFEAYEGPAGEPWYRTRQDQLRDFHFQSFPKAKGGRYRIFAVGGSITHGWGIPDPLKDGFVGQSRALLEREMPGKPVEAINVGGIGYGSYRVAILLKELVEYDPDLIVVFQGENEFWEHPIYERISAGSENERVVAVSKLLGRSRVYSVIRDQLLESNEEKLSVPASFRGGYSVFNDTKYERVKRRFRANVAEIAKVAGQKSIPVVMATLPSNLQVNPSVQSDSLWDSSHHLEPLSAEDLERWERSYEAGQRALLARDFERALGFFQESNSIDATYARLHHMLGRTYLSLGRYDEAYESFWTHIERSRRTITRDLNAIIQQQCEQPHVHCLDGRELFEAAAGNRLPGYDLFVDSVHPNERGHQLLAAGLLQKIIPIVSKPSG